MVLTCLFVIIHAFEFEIMDLIMFICFQFDLLDGDKFMLIYVKFDNVRYLLMICDKW